MMQRAWTILLVLLLLVPSVFAQEDGDPFQPLWDAINDILNKIHNMRVGIGVLRGEFNAHVDHSNQFENDVNDSINSLNATDFSLQTQLNDVNTMIETNQTIVNQQLSDLNQVDQQLVQTDVGLQDQINSIPVGNISRGRLYEVFSTALGVKEVYCADENDILINHYCSGGYLGETTAQQGIVTDDFSDGDYTNNPPWNPTLGNWTIVSHALLGAGLGGGSINTSINMQSGRDYHLHVKMQQGTANTMGAFKWFAINSGYQASGYEIVFHDNGNIYLYKNVDGTQTMLTQLSIFQQNIPYVIDIDHHPNGVIEVYVDGVLKGTVTDTQFDSGSLITFWTGNGNGNYFFDDVSVTYSPVNYTGGFLNVSNPVLPMGIKCNFGWEARIVCYNPD